MDRNEAPAQHAKAAGNSNSPTPTATAPVLDSTATPMAPPASIAGLAVLVIDDDADARDLIVAALRDAGANGLAASSPAYVAAMPRILERSP